MASKQEKTAEQRWLDDEHFSSSEMIDLLKKMRRADPRKLRLYACVWARVVWDAYGHKSHRRLVELAEDHADGLISAEELEEARRDARQYRDEWETIEDGSSVCPSLVADAAACDDAVYGSWDAHYEAHCVIEYLPQAHVTDPGQDEDKRLLYEMFDNPYRPRTVDPAWVAHADGAVLALARSAYRERILPRGMLNPQRLGVLADALQDAGCDDDHILGHLRDKGPHYRGCWVVDLVRSVD